ncbi:hypothetical protein Tco_0036681, partial [Tanacetum coccineum]
LLKVFEVVIERTTKDGEVVHEYFHAILDELMEYCCHAALKSVGALHTPKGIRLYAKVSQSFKHLIDERKGKVIFLGYVIQLAVVDTNAPSSDGLLWYELILLILNYGHPYLL